MSGKMTDEDMVAHETQISLNFIANALRRITEEEKKKSLKKRLTQLQKNRIALNYVRFREEISRSFNEKDD